MLRAVQVPGARVGAVPGALQPLERRDPLPHAQELTLIGLDAGHRRVEIAERRGVAGEVVAVEAAVGRQTALGYPAGNLE